MKKQANGGSGASKLERDNARVKRGNWPILSPISITFARSLCCFISFSSLSLSASPSHTHSHTHSRTPECIFDKFSCACSGDGKYVVSGTYNNTFSVFNAAQGTLDSRLVLGAREGPRQKRAAMLSQTSNTEEINFLQKVLHIDWSKKDDCLAIAGQNRLFIYCGSRGVDGSLIRDMRRASLRSDWSSDDDMMLVEESRNIDRDNDEEEDEDDSDQMLEVSIPPPGSLGM